MSPVWLGGVGPKMTEVAGEVADGFLVHPFCTPRSLLEVTLPALARGRARSALPDRIKLSLPVMIVTGMSEVAFDEALQAVRTQIAFSRSEEHTSELQSLKSLSYAAISLKK